MIGVQEVGGVEAIWGSSSHFKLSNEPLGANAGGRQDDRSPASKAGVGMSPFGVPGREGVRATLAAEAETWTSALGWH